MCFDLGVETVRRVMKLDFGGGPKPEVLRCHLRGWGQARTIQWCCFLGIERGPIQYSTVNSYARSNVDLR